MSKNKLELGQVVRLKSGGPRMTITTVNNNDTYACTWFMNGKPEHAAFPTSALAPAPKPTDEDTEEDEYE
jgi:uncharacterized protein YodC (DUF2158 family)